MLMHPFLSIHYDRSDGPNVLLLCQCLASSFGDSPMVIADWIPRCFATWISYLLSKKKKHYPTLSSLSFFIPPFNCPKCQQISQMVVVFPPEQTLKKSVQSIIVCLHQFIMTFWANIQTSFPCQAVLE